MGRIILSICLDLKRFIKYLRNTKNRGKDKDEHMIFSRERGHPKSVEKGGMTIIPSEALAESRDLADITPDYIF